MGPLLQFYIGQPLLFTDLPLLFTSQHLPQLLSSKLLLFTDQPLPLLYTSLPLPLLLFKPAPAVAYQPYVDPYPAEDAIYTYQYAVKDDYSGNDLGAQEARERELTNGQYNVLLPDGRLQTVTYTVNGGEGYVADVQYAGEAQYPVAVAPAATYSS